MAAPPRNKFEQKVNSPYGGHCYVIVHSNLSSQQKIVQAIHASLEAAIAGLIQAHHPHLVLAEAPDLSCIIDKLDFKGIKYATFNDSDLGIGITAIATEPLFDNRRILSKLSLIGG